MGDDGAVKMGGVGKDVKASNIASLVKPVSNVAQKAATAGKLKSIKLKMKMK